MMRLDSSTVFYLTLPLREDELGNVFLEGVIALRIIDNRFVRRKLFYQPA